LKNSEVKRNGSLRLGIIGAGIMGRHHAQTVAGVGGIEVVGVCDVVAERAQALASQFDVEAYTSWLHLIAGGVDAVAICVVHALHAEIAVGAMERGCHVLVEKPMAVSVDECDRMLAAAQRQSRYLKVAEPELYRPIYRRIRQLYQSGSLGRFLSGRFQQIRPYFTEQRPKWYTDPKLSGGGMFMNLGPHRLGIVRACLPDLTADWVDAQVITRTGQEVEAFVSGRVGYREGCVIQFDQIGHFSPPKPWTYDRFLIFEEAFVSWTEEKLTIAWRDGREDSEPIAVRENDYLPIYEDFLRGIAGDCTDCPPVEEMARDVAVICAIYESGRLGRRVSLENGSVEVTVGEKG
jgi:predicted dehydrogenase